MGGELRKLGRMLNAADLPDDIAAVKAMLLASDIRAAQSEARAMHLPAELSTRTAEIDHLNLVLAKLKRMQFGRSSEKLDQQIGQMELQLEDLEAEEAVAEAQAPAQVMSSLTAIWLYGYSRIIQNEFTAN